MVHASRFSLITLFLFAMSLNAQIYRPFPRGNTDNISGLVFCINQAISTPDDDIIDLGGAIYTLDGTNLFFDNDGGSNGLPIITAGSGKLSIITGTIARSPLLSTPFFRFFFIEADAPVYLYNVTLEHGSSLLIGADANIPNNRTDQNGILANGQDGGAIYNLGILNLRNSFFIDNNADGVGGAVYNNGTITEIFNSVFSSNRSNTFNIFDGGGAIFNDVGGVIVGIIDTTISDNRANNAHGGGIYNGGIIQSIRNSAIANNFAFQNGGGIYNHEINLKANFEITAEITSLSSNTIYGNVASNGAGIFNDSIIVGANNNTIAANGSGGTALGGGIYNDVGGTIGNLIANIIASNVAEVGPDLFDSGSIANNKYNLVSNTGGNTIVNGLNNNIVTATPLLGSFQDNGGPTFTIALLPGSLAINNGNNPDALSYDQRGFPHYRTICGVIDIGAYERPGCHN